jgi:RNA polymerase sigma-70 factor, ECF subfamily
MVPVEPTARGGCATLDAELDPDSAEWLRSLGGSAPESEAAQIRLHALLLRIARSEVRRRSGQLKISGPELDDVAHQAANDALMAIIAKTGQFRGDSRFTTWAYKFVMFEVSTKIGRHIWRNPAAPIDAEHWERLPNRLALDPAQETEWRELVAALRRAIDTVLTDRQRRIFVSIVLNKIPVDALAAELGSNRNAIYKTLFDARRKLRATLVANGYLDNNTSRRS